MEIKADIIIELYNKRVAELEHEVLMLKAQLIQLQDNINKEEK